MTTIYVHALSDTPVMPWEEDDGRRIESIPVGGLFAVGERRADTPAMTEAELQRQHAIVQRIAEAAPAVLPARFGSLVDESELTAIVRQRSTAIAAAFALVRGNVQMTIRFAVAGPKAPSGVAASGREYLQRRRDDLSPPLPAPGDRALRAVRAFVVDERRKATDVGRVAVFHLVRREDVTDYRVAIAEAAFPGMSVSGPFPPFAFAPEF